MPPTLAATVNRPIATPRALHDWIETYARLSIPTQNVCPHHNAPFDYLCSAYFEPARDLVVWAPRGGGKTSLGAIATLLDLLHKPHCNIRILGGSLDQSLRMWEHLYPLLLDLARDRIQGRPQARILRLDRQCSAAVLTQSQRAVRGLRVQKLRCDEVELFDPQIWQAAQLVTRSSPTPPSPSQSSPPPSPSSLSSSLSLSSSSSPLNPEPRPLNPSPNPDPRLATSNQQLATPVSGTIEALSTLHTPFGLMHRILENAQRIGTPIIRWCLLEVLERCPPDRDCKTCPLWADCKGIAKTRCDGFVSIDDAIAMKQRVSLEQWQCEMLCQRPSQRHAVFPTFNPEIHVTPAPPAPTPVPFTQAPLKHLGISLSIDFGFASPFVCLWILREQTHTIVLDEYVQPHRQLDEHLEQIRRRPYAAQIITCDPAGNARSDQTSLSNVSLLRKAGYIVRSRQSHIVDGLELIRAALSPAIGPPRLFIHPRCHRLIDALRSYRYAEGGSELPIKDGQHDHLIDPLRYHFINCALNTAITHRAY